MNLLTWLHSCSSEVQPLETTNKTLVLEEEQGLSILASQEGRRHHSLTARYFYIRVPMQRDRKTSTQSWLRHDSPESVWRHRQGRPWRMGAREPTPSNTHQGTTCDVSGQQCLVSSRSYSQCALNVFYTGPTWNWSERLVTCLQDIKTQRSQVFLGCSLQVHSAH